MNIQHAIVRLSVFLFFCFLEYILQFIKNSLCGCSIFPLCSFCRIIWLSSEINALRLITSTVHQGRQGCRERPESLSWWCEALLSWPPKLSLSALIDCHSFLPEGRRCYRRQTAGGSSCSARQTSRQFHIHWCAARGCLNMRDYWIQMSSLLYSPNISPLPTLFSALLVFAFTALRTCPYNLPVSHTWLGPHGLHAQIP